MYRKTPRSNFDHAEPGDRYIMDGLKSNHRAIISLSSLDVKEDIVQVLDLEQLGSYNWVESSSPTIIVPGAPRAWTGRAVPYKVAADTGASFCDQNGYRMPGMSLYPLLKAADIQTPSFDWSSIDFVSDRNGLRKLLRFIDQGVDAKNWRIDMQLSGKTLLFGRWETRYREQLSGYTFGFNFETASTSVVKGCEKATGHHRIITYDLSGLKMVVRFEVDAYLLAQSSSQDADDLLDSLASLSLGAAVTRPAPNKKDPLLAIMRGGKDDIPQSALVELTTRSENRARDFTWTDPFPQLFLSQTPHHFLGVHNRGTFSRVQKSRMGSSELASVEARAQPSFRKLVALLGVIKELVVKSGERGRLSLVCQEGDLKVYERESQDGLLPDEMLERFE